MRLATIRTATGTSAVRIDGDEAINGMRGLEEFQEYKTYAQIVA